jgi:hypothetical protein
MKIRILAAASAALLVLGTLRADIPFIWLDKPSGRNNPQDPGSPEYPALRASHPSPASSPAAPSGPSSRGAASPAAAPKGNAVVFDDFESGAWKPAPSYMFDLGPLNGAEAGAPIACDFPPPSDGGSLALAEDITFTAAGGTAQVELKSEYGDGWGGPISVTSAARPAERILSLEIRSDVPLTLGLALRDAQSPAVCSRFRGAALSVAAGAWQKVCVPLDLGAWDFNFASLHLDELEGVILLIQGPASGAPLAAHIGIDNIVFGRRSPLDGR